MPRIPITDLGGSLNQGKAPSELLPGEFTVLKNFYQFGSKLRRRGGMRRVTDSAFTERITGLVSYRPEILPPGGVDMMVAGLTRWGRLKGNSIALIPNQTGFVIPTSTKRWSMFQYKNICYGIRSGIGLVRSDGTYVGPAGIAAPTAAPVIADGAAGDIPAASFKAVYTFYNANTGVESNPSPVSNTLVHAGSKKIDWTGIAVSTNAQVTSRRIYRSLPDASGEYFLVDEIANNSATTYTGDNTLAQDLDTAVSQTNGVPPSGLLFGVVHKERLFTTDGKDLLHSEDGMLESFDPDAVIPIFPDDMHDISALHSYGDRLIVAETDKVHYLVGSGPDTFSPGTLSDRHGCISHHSMKSAEGLLLWLGVDNVYRSDGNDVKGIASVKLRDIIEGMDAAAARDAFAAVYPTYGWYILVIPGYAQLIYNYRADVWAEVTTAEMMQMLGDFYDTDFVQALYTTDDSGYVYHFHDRSYGRDDSAAVLGAAITATFDTRAFGAEAATKHIVERVGLICPRYAESVTLGIVSEGAVLNSKVKSLDYEERWKLYGLSSRSQAKAMTQLRLTYTGATEIELEGYSVDISPLGRPVLVR